VRTTPSRGDPESELAWHYNTIAPWLVQKDDTPASPRSLALDACEWVMRIWKLHPGLLPEQTTQARSRRETCSKCPHFVATKLNGGTVYGDHADMRAILLSGNYDYQIFGCARTIGQPDRLANEGAERPCYPA
jgi:hypothetical protein